MKKLDVIYENSLRDLVGHVNHDGIQKENIVNILKEEENYILLYYR
jgi:hypothetical protein